MGNSCKSRKKDENAKQHFNSTNNLNNDEKDENQSNTQNNIKNEEIKNEPKNIENKKVEIEKEEKESKKIFKVNEEKENIGNDVDNFSEDESTCNLKLEISLKKVANQRKHVIEIYEYKNSRKTDKKKIDETESKSASPNKSIDFEKDIIIPFHFSQNQPLEFIINKDTDNIIISKTLGEIVGSLRQTYRENLQNGMIFEVKAILNDELNKKCVFNIEVSGSLVGMKIGYSIKSLGNQYEPINKLVYESEIKDNNNNLIKFNESEIPVSELAADENLVDNIIEIEFKDVLHSNELGKFKSSINELFLKTIDFDLGGNKKAKIICRRKNFHSLLDYLERDLHLATTLFIDFSESGETNTHHIEKNETIFEKLMKSFLEILEPYNEDAFFHIFGYGFKLKEPLKNKYDPDMFPINKKVDYPSISSQDIKKFYYEFLNSINFNKAKTNLHLIIKKFNDGIKKDIDEYDIREYNILLLFANNDITEEKEFINNIIFSSSLPISIVIVGLGKGPFTKLEKIEENFLNLKNYEGNHPQRKCIKFVSFNDNKKNVQSTVKKSLINIPDEMIEYLGIKNIEPTV